VERFRAPFTERIDVDGAEFRHVTDGRRADTERSFTVDDDKRAHRV
jgi:hypothetical protein